MLEIKSSDNKSFEDIKHLDEDGNEFWLARELQPVLQYAKWQNFNKVINAAKIACLISQHNVDNHFTGVSKMVEVGSGATKEVNDYKLTRYACYLIVMNGDPRKEVIANGQTYFAVKTRQQEYQELFDKLTEDDKRLFLRSDVKQKNILLNKAAHNAGIKTSFEYADFHDAGYRGLYGGMNSTQIAKNKNLKQGEEILDYMGSTELAANLFRITQTEEVMKRNNISTKNVANSTHYEIGKGVRETIKKFGNTMPENLPTPSKSIREIETDKQERMIFNKPKKDKK